MTSLKPLLRATFGLGFLLFGACSEISRTPVVQVSDALFVEGDSALFYLRHQYVWYEESSPIVVGKDQEDGHAQIIKVFPNGEKQILLDIPGLGDSYVSIHQLVGDTLVYTINSSNNSTVTTYFRDMNSGIESSYRVNDGYVFRVSHGGGYLFSAKQIRNRTTGEVVDGISPPPYPIVFFDEFNGRFLIRHREKGLAFWDVATKAVDPVKPILGSVSWTYADEGELIVFREVELVRGAVPSHYFMKVSDLLAGKKIFQYIAVPFDYAVFDVSLDEESIAMSKYSDFDQSDDTLRVYDFSGNLKRKLPGRL